MYGEPMGSLRAKDGARIDLIPPRRDYLPQLVAALNDPMIMRYLNPAQSPTTVEKECAYLEELKADEASLNWQILRDGEFVGAVWINGISHRPLTGDYGILLADPSCWNTGINTVAGNAVAEYAFTVEGFTKLKTSVLEPNAASKRRALKAGYEEYGFELDAAYVDGMLCGKWLAALSLKAWKTLHGLGQVPFEVRLAVPDDAEGITRVQKLGWLTAYPNADLGITRAKIEQRFADPERIKRRGTLLSALDPAKRVWVAETRDGVIGFAIASTEPACELNALYVDPLHHGSGVGSALMRAALTWLGGSEVKLGVVSYNHGAIGFYRRFGFVVDGPAAGGHPNFTDGTTLPEVRMVRK